MESERNKVMEIREEADNLRSEGQQLREQARMKLVDYIRLGALVKGECEVCKEIEKI